VTLLDPARVALAVFVAAIVQTSILNAVDLGGGTPDLLLVTLVAVALLRGPIYGAAAGFVGGLVVDTALLGTLGQTSLLLTVAGYWIGRYGETTGRERDRSHAPLLSIVVVTILYSVCALALHFMLGDAVSARLVLVDALLPAVVLNVLLALPVYAVARRLLPPTEVRDRAREVTLLG
jgi:rod shape-determining protein MreD